jgi:hypothetical protein
MDNDATVNGRKDAEIDEDIKIMEVNLKKETLKKKPLTFKKVEVIKP